MADTSPERGTVSHATGNLNPWTALLQAMAPEVALGGFTMRELGAQTGRCRHACLEMVRQGIMAGVLRASRKRYQRMDGTTITVASYLPIEGTE